MHTTPLAVAAALALAATAARAQHPDFTGTYKLDLQASRGDSVGPLPHDRFAAGLLRIEGHDPTIVLHGTFLYQVGNRDTTTITLHADGHPVIERDAGRTTTTVSLWSGDTLVTTNRWKAPTDEGTTTTRLSLADGGRTLEWRDRTANPRQTYEMVLVFRRLGGSGGRD